MAASLHPDPLELVCPADTPAALRAAVDAGADAVRCGFGDASAARDRPGFDVAAPEFADAVRYAHRGGARVLVAIETFARPGALDLCCRAVDRAAAAGADAVVVADLAVLDYAARTRPELHRHLSARAAARTPEAIRFYREGWAVRRVVLPRGLTVEEISRLDRAIEVETEAVVAAASCVMAEGRCRLSSQASGCPPPAEADAAAGDPVRCTGVFKVAGEAGRLFAAPPGLATATLLGGLQAAGVTALQIEGGGEADTAAVVGAFRRALDAVARGKPPAEVARRLAVLAEGGAAPATAR
ncbi:MAG: U32 family peptidase [Alphaproteobacteria bacterium]|jgi:putative protease|nr:U32 family peptidase [Alphaproteobacteria bacterium]